MVSLERLGWAVAVPILVAAVFFTPQWIPGGDRSSPAAAIATDIALSADSREPATDSGEAEPAAEAFVDLYGNEVTDAIATYTFDQAGSLYELHSPQTELPRLGTPKS